MDTGYLPQLQELLLRDAIQSGHRIVRPPVWCEPGCFMTSHPEDSQAERADSASVAELRDRLFVPRAVIRDLTHSNLLVSQSF